MDLLNYEGNPSSDPNDCVKMHNVIQEGCVKDFSRQTLSIAALTTDLSIPLPGNPTTYLAILIDYTISIKLNGDTTSLTLSPKIDGRRTLAFFNRGAITALTVSNPSTTAIANIDIIAVTI